MRNEKKSEVPAWLKRIQEGSWEPEILISGIVLFGLLKIYPLIGDLNYFLEMNSSSMFSNGTVNENLCAILRFANIILIIGFLLHILFRSVWVAFVGLSYVYKSGINYERLKYPKKYLNTIKEPGDYTANIIKLEKICSVIFAISFLVFMWIFGLSFFFSIIATSIGVFNAIFPGNYDYELFNNILLIICSLVLIDFITLGGLRKIPYLRIIYFPIYKAAGWLTLSFLYRNIFYGIISNHRKWIISIILSVFAILTFVSVMIILSRDWQPGRTITLAPYRSNAHRLDEAKYRNKVTDGRYSKKMHIEDYVVANNFLEVFIVHTTRDEEDWILPACNYYEVKEQENVSYDSLRMACLEKFYGIALDEKLLPDEFIYQRNSQTGQDGLIQIIDISSLKNGKHKIDLYYDFYNFEKDTVYHNIAEQIYFYKMN